MKIFTILFVLLLAACSARSFETASDLPAYNTRRTTRQTARQNTRQTTERSTRQAPPAPIPRAVSDNAHETQYDTADSARSANIALAAGSIDGTIVQSGEVFSFNETIGSTTKKHGYKKAVIYAGGRKSKNYGGGVCQVSTTLYNAAMNAGMTILERHDHSLPVNYAESGKEAATSQNGNLDFKFQNDSPNSVIINARAENGTLRVDVSEI
jgi:vancomycin resistance protein YoaR